MALDPRIILAGQPVNVLGAVGSANQMAAQQGEFQHQNALRSMLQQNGPGIMAGDQQALGALSRFDPNAAFGIKADQERLQMARAAAARAAASAKDQARLREEVKMATGGLRNMAFALKSGDQRAWRQMAAEFGAPDLPMDASSFALLASTVEGLDEGLRKGMIGAVTPAQGPEPTAEMRNLEWRAAQAGLRPGTPEYSQFIMSGGRNDGMVIESDGQGGISFRQGAAAVGGKPFTEGQSKDNVFVTRARGAANVLDPIADKLTSRTNRAAELDPTGLAREFQDEDFQVAKQAGDEFLQAILRKDTGAAITEPEQFLYGRTYLPQPGDGPKVLEAKKAARQRAVAAIEAGMSPAQMIAVEKALGNTPDEPEEDQAAPDDADAQTFEAFKSDPSVIAAAKKYGVTPEEMWAIKQEGQ